ncbi:succinate dehydrogenase, cytochrome b556 subunit [Stakelama sediminis]
MLVSILHRVTGDGMALVGTVLIVWWLAALSGGSASYAAFMNVFTLHTGALNVIGYIVGIGLTLCFFQHLASGIRHFILDVGAGYELKANRRYSILTIVFSILATAAFWAYLIWGK